MIKRIIETKIKELAEKFPVIPVTCPGQSGNTFNHDFFKQLNYWNKLAENNIENSYVIYGGDSIRYTKDGTLLRWEDVAMVPVV